MPHAKSHPSSNPGRLLKVATLLVVIWLPWAAQGEPRHALLIGNGAYPEFEPDYNKLLPLSNPTHDVDAMNSLLTDFGFDRVEPLKNLSNKKDMIKAVNSFADGLPRGATAVLYYSGHGIGQEDKNYLLSTGHGYHSTTDVSTHGLSAEWVLGRLTQSLASRVIMILDACREHISLDQRKGPREESFGNIVVNAPEGVSTLIAYATGPGQFAWGDSRHELSLYTRHLVDNLRTHAGENISKALEETIDKVYNESTSPQNRRYFRFPQRPRFNFGLIGKWCLSPSGCVGPPQPPVDPIKTAQVTPAQKAEQPLPKRTKLPKPVLIDGFSPAQLAERRRQTAEALGIPERYDEQLPGGVRLPMVLIPGGRFTMGSPEGKGDPDQHPQQKISIQPFYMAETHTTQAQWEALGQANESRYRGKAHPVGSVSWNTAQGYIEALKGHANKGYRLPTEAQWEYAARAGSTGEYGWGDEQPVCEKGKSNSAVFDDDNRCNDTGTQPAPFSAANGFGLYDMAGQLWQWVEDCYRGHLKVQPQDGAAWKTDSCETVVLRGGSWSDFPGDLRAAYRSRSTPDNRFFNFGFRVVRAAP